MESKHVNNLQRGLAMPSNRRFRCGGAASTYVSESHLAVRAYLDKRLLKQGGTISSQIAGKYLEQHQIVARRLVAGLQTIELQILICLIRGMSASNSAALIDISLDELERFRASMMKKLNAHTNADAVRIGLYADLDN